MTRARMGWAGLVGLAAVAVAPNANAQAEQDLAQDSVLTYHGSADRSGHFMVPGLTWQWAAGT